MPEAPLQANRKANTGEFRTNLFSYSSKQTIIFLRNFTASHQIYKGVFKVVVYMFHA